MKNKNKKILTAIFVAFILIVAGIRENYRVVKDTNNSRALSVSKVIDGDTVQLLNGKRVRYIGIDTPEMRERDGARWVYKPRPYAEKAKDFNRGLVEGKVVRLEYDVQKKDKYNRTLAYVFAGDIMVNLELIRQGYAMIYTYPPNVKYAEKFLEAQKYARENKRGLWGDAEGNVISSYQAKDNMGKIRGVEAKVIDTYLSERVLILKCEGNFKAAIFRNNLTFFPKEVLRSPDSYFKNKAIRVYGVIKDYKGSCEIVVNDPSQLEILK